MHFQYKSTPVSCFIQTHISQIERKLHPSCVCVYVYMSKATWKHASRKWKVINMNKYSFNVGQRDIEREEFAYLFHFQT